MMTTYLAAMLLANTVASTGQVVVGPGIGYRGGIGYNYVTPYGGVSSARYYGPASFGPVYYPTYGQQIISGSPFTGGYSWKPVPGPVYVAPGGVYPYGGFTRTYYYP